MKDFWKEFQTEVRTLQSARFQCAATRWRRAPGSNPHPDEYLYEHLSSTFSNYIFSILEYTLSLYIYIYFIYNIYLSLYIYIYINIYFFIYKKYIYIYIYMKIYIHYKNDNNISRDIYIMLLYVIYYILFQCGFQIADSFSMRRVNFNPTVQSIRDSAGRKTRTAARQSTLSSSN